MTSTAWRVTITPAVALGLLAAVWGHELPPVLVAVVALVLIAAVQVAVYHAEVVAHRVGEPFGSLVLAIAVTVIEVGLILSLMASGDPEAASLPRDTVFAAVMIICNGVIGLCLMVGALRHRVVAFNAEGSSGALATVALVVLLPETLAAVRAARRDRLQTSFNLALGSALASIGLIILAIAVATIWLPMPLVLGLSTTEMILLALSMLIGTLTVVAGRATVLQGAVHLLIFASFLFTAVAP